MAQAPWPIYIYIYTLFVKCMYIYIEREGDIDRRGTRCVRQLPAELGGQAQKQRGITVRGTHVSLYLSFYILISLSISIYISLSLSLYVYIYIYISLIHILIVTYTCRQCGGPSSRRWGPRRRGPAWPCLERCRDEIMCIYIYVYMYVYMYMCVYIHIYICIYIYIYIYIHTGIPLSLNAKG